MSNWVPETREREFHRNKYINGMKEIKFKKKSENWTRIGNDVDPQTDEYREFGGHQFGNGVKLILLSFFTSFLFR